MSTIKDVAALAGVSTATVSLALNGKTVNEETRKHVIRCARQLQYVPNRMGQNLINGKSNTIHIVILNSIKYTNLIVDTTFFYSYIEGVLEEIGVHNYSVTFEAVNWEDDDLKSYFYRKVHSNAADGLIIIPQFIRDFTFLDVLDGFPYVILNSHVQSPDINSYNVNNYLGGKIIATYLAQCGFRNIAFINGPDEHYDASERKRGFLDIIKGKDIKIIEESGDWTIPSGYSAAMRLYSTSAVDAIFCGNDFMAAGVLRYLYQNMIKVPEDVSLIGYDNVGIAKAIYPRLTTVDGHLPEIGRALGRYLLHEIDPDTYPREVSPPMVPRLVIRESTKPND